MRRVYMDCDEFKAQNEVQGTGLPFCGDIAVLGESVQMGAKTAPNRLVCQPMEGCDGTADGAPGELTRRRYLRFAEGGAGMIWFEATACCEEGRANPRQLRITENNLDDFKRIVEEIREAGRKKNGYAPLVIMQDTHSGRYSRPKGKPEPIIAYHNPILEDAAPVDSSRILSDEGMDQVRDKLVEAARLAEAAGFDGVDIKCCHGYLNAELLSAYHREGRYGGSLEGRTRLLREAAGGAAKSCGRDFIIAARLNLYDGFPYPWGFGVSEGGGLAFDPKEPAWLLQELEKAGVALVNLTMGNPYYNPHINRPFAVGSYEPEESPLEGAARMLHGAEKMKQAVPGLKVVGSGMSYLGVAAPFVAAGFIRRGGFDFAGFGRQAFAYPDL